MFETKVVEKITTRVLCTVTLSLKLCHLLDMWKNTVEMGRPNANVAHAHCMLDTQGYKYTLRICNNYRFPTVTMVARTRLNVTL